MFLKSNQGTSLVTVVLAMSFVGLTTMTVMDMSSISQKIQGTSDYDRTWSILKQNLDFTISSSRECTEAFKDGNNNVKLNKTYLGETLIPELKWRGQRFITSGLEVDKVSLVNRSSAPEVRLIYDTATPPNVIATHNRYSAKLEIYPKTDANRVSKAVMGYMIYVETDLSDYLQTCYLKLCTQDALPVANKDYGTVASGQTTLIDVISNDIAADPVKYPLRLVKVSTAAHGVTSIDTASGKVKYVSSSGFSGTDSFTYVVSDGCQDTVGEVSVRVLRKMHITVGSNTVNYNTISYLPFEGVYDGLDQTNNYVRVTSDGTQPECIPCPISSSSCVSVFSPTSVYTFILNVWVAGPAVKFLACEKGTNNPVAKLEFTIGQKLFYNPGTYSFTVPSKITNVWFSMLAGGGGGGGGKFPNGGGGGGAGEGYYFYPLTVTPGQVISIINGGGGAGGAEGMDGGDGQASSFGGIIALGGQGGRGATDLAPGAGGAGGGGTPGGTTPGAAGGNVTLDRANHKSAGAGGGIGAASLQKSGAGGDVLTMYVGGKACTNSGTIGGAGGGGGASFTGNGGNGVCTGNAAGATSPGAGGGGAAGDSWGTSYSKFTNGGGGQSHVFWFEE